MHVHFPVLKKIEYFSLMVSAATFAPPGEEVQTFLNCRKRPNRKPCPGHISVRLEEEPAQLHWWCSCCGNRGIIKSWKGVMEAMVQSGTEIVSGKG
ncbi:MAG TPA: hypothetical protein VHO70_21705 [Chitinispirillaceae bacterium]|nr:hypothetical protein [Chitinispirillaceae bacterium]